MSIPKPPRARSPLTLPEGHAFGAFWPDVVTIPIQARHLQYHWNGERASRWFEYGADRWHDLT